METALSSESKSAFSKLVATKKGKGKRRCSTLLALLITNLLKLTHSLLLTRITNQTYPVDPSLVTLAVSIDHEDD
jgi:hypothetical protein